MDPEQVYAEVLAEEQQKGSSGPVAEGRAKAARARAEAGSPHPKEPKWWAGAQPHLEAAGAEAVEPEPAPAEEPEPEPAAGEAPAAATIETPVPEGPAQPAPQVAAEAQGAATAEEQAATRPPDQQPAAAPPPVPADQPPAAQPGQQPAVQPAAAVATAPAPAEAAPPQRPAGVTHGTTTGTRLRPEDEVTTEAQFTGQEAMYQRRKLIDELVGTGVPAVAAEDTGRSGSPMMAVLYLIIPLIAIAFLVAQGGSGTETAPTGGEAPGAGGASGPSIVAEGVQFNTDTLELPAGEPFTLTFENKDSVEHNVAIYETDEAEKELFVGEIFAGQDTMEYEVPALKKGEYYFQCDVHPNMNGDALVK